MWHNKLFLSSILVCVLLVSVFVVSVEASSTTWSRTYGGNDTDSAETVIQTSDGGYVIVGQTQSFGAELGDLWLVKTNSSGITEWVRIYGGEGLDVAYSVVETTDGGYALAGLTCSFGAGLADFWLIKTGASGNMEWNRTYGGTGDDSARSLCVTSDGGYAIAGFTNSFDADHYDFWLIKTDAFGNMEWNRTYGGTGVDEAFSLVATSDGGYAIAGFTDSFGAGYYDFWLVKTDVFGNMEWNQTYGGEFSDRAYSLVATSDGGYAIAGVTLFDFWLVKTDESRNVEWSHTSGDGAETARSVVETSDGGFVLAGVKDADTHWLSFAPISGYCLLVKTDAFGNTEWNRIYEGDNVAWATSVIQTSDGGYVIAGRTYSFDAENSDAWLIKTDKYGILPEFYPPYICVDSQKNLTYTTNNFSLNFTVNEETTWMGYSLDGQDNVTLTETTLNLTELADGSHNMTIYTTDTDGNTAASETISFTITKDDETTTEWTTFIIVTAAVAIAIVAVILYFTRTRKTIAKDGSILVS